MTQNSPQAMTAEEIRKAMSDNPDTHLSPEQTTPPSHQQSFLEDLKTIDPLYSEAVSYARNFMDNVRAGQNIDITAARPFVRNLISSVFRNESAAATIGKLKTFDEYTYNHCVNVSVLAVILGKRLGYSENELELAGMAGMFHDVGKARIPNRILNKPGKLTDSEMDTMRKHPLYGYTILQAMDDIPEEIVRGSLEHHEKFDGSGYPRGLKGNTISEIGRLLSVVDVYDALTSKRVYKAPMAPGQVLAKMYQARVSDFHPEIMEQFIKSLGIYPVGSFVRLTTGEYGIVIDSNIEKPLSPTVRLIYNRQFKQIPSKTLELKHISHIKIADIINPEEHGINLLMLLH